MHVIDLNADLGETVDTPDGTVPTADDEAMFAVISSASIACGGHAGDAASMADAAARASRTGVAIGAHPSYADRENFGRVRVEVDPATLQGQLEEQFAALRAAGADIRYVKPHGALYHAAGGDPATAGA
ncbi:MAG TPA: LamB/YcsF family protein, partial [Microbacterium sp.]|nr:LamB/YcsF family protein [Microbacterium sp.]